MDVNTIKAELGIVTGQLLEYEYRIVPKSAQTKGQAGASSSARGWIESLVQSSFRPGEDVQEGFHSATPGTCDAVEFRYSAGKEPSQLDIRIHQTIFAFSLSAALKVSPGQWKGNAELAASELGQQLFLQSERLNLRGVKTVGPLSFGEQVTTSTKPSDRRDWLDTMRWWSDGTTIGFTVLKRTGEGQAYKPSWDVQPNQVWFAMFERPRVR